MFKKVLLGMVMATLCSSLAMAANTDTSGVGGRSITAFDRLSKTKVGGYFDTEWVSNDTTNTFRAHRMIVQVSSQIHDNILFNSEIEYEYGGYLSGDSDTDGEIKIEQAWLDFRLTDAFIARSGIMVIPFGIVNTLHDSDVRDTTNRPIYAKYIVPTTWMDTGIGAHGEIELPNDWGLNYEAYLINGLQDAVSGTNGVRSARPEFKTDNNKSSAFAGRLSVSPMAGLDLGTSYYTGNYNDDDDKNLSIVGFDGIKKFGPTEILGEFATVSLEPSASTPTHMNGFYVEGRYHFMPEFIKTSLVNNGFSRPTFTLFGRYSQVDLDTSVDNSYDLSQITLGANFRPTETVVFKLEYEINDSDGTNPSNAIYGSVAAGF